MRWSSVSRLSLRAPRQVERMKNKRAENKGGKGGGYVVQRMKDKGVGKGGRDEGRVDGMV